MDFGRWQGLSWRQIRRRDPRAADRWLKHFASQPIPGAERFRQFKRRIQRGLKAIVGANRDAAFWLSLTLASSALRLPTLWASRTRTFSDWRKTTVL